MFRMVLPPTIRSVYNCIYSIWYLSHPYCYLPLSWKSWNRFECAVSGVRVVCAPDDTWKYHPKHVEQFPDINKLCDVASRWIHEYIIILLGARRIIHISRIKFKRTARNLLHDRHFQHLFYKQILVSEQWFTWRPVLEDSCTVTQGNWRFGQVTFVCKEGNFNNLLIIRVPSPSVCKFAWKWRYITTMCSCLKLVLWTTSWHSMLHARYVNVNIIRNMKCVVMAAVRKMFRRNIYFLLIKNFMVSCWEIRWIWRYGLGSRGLLW
jgi:hypothetical protein